METDSVDEAAVTAEGNLQHTNIYAGGNPLGQLSLPTYSAIRIERGMQVQKNAQTQFSPMQDASNMTLQIGSQNEYQA